MRGGEGRVTRTEKDGRNTVFAGEYDGKRLHAPNDLVYAIDGSIYFTDLPRRDAAPDPARTGFAAVYQITPKGVLRLATRELTRPNGVALGPKQLTLYVADSAANNVRVFEISGDGSIAKGRVFAECERPDGLKTDEAGNVYVAGPGGISVFSTSGRLSEIIEVPEPPSNCNWGAGFRGLYITARTSVYFVPGIGPGTRTY